MNDAYDDIHEDGANGAGPDLILAINRQHLYSIDGLEAPVPYPILEAINEEPVFCADGAIAEGIDLAQILTQLLVINPEGQIAVDMTGALPRPEAVSVAVTAFELPMLAAIRRAVGDQLGLPPEGPRRPTILAILHQPSLDGLSKAGVLVYFFRQADLPANCRWANPDELTGVDAAFVPALEHVPG